MSDITDKVAELEAAEKKLQEKQVELDKSSATLAEKETQKSAMDAELERVKTDIAKAKEERRQKETSFQDKLRNENLEAAKKKFFDEFGYKEEDKQKFLETFKGFDSNSVNADLIFQDMMKAHVAANPAKYIELERKVAKLTESSNEFKEAMSGSAFAGSGSLPADNEFGLTKEDLQAASWAGLSPQRYSELKKKGAID